MSFFRNLFESKPAQTDQEYTISLVDQLLNDKASPFLISNLKEFSHDYADEISSRGIPALVKAFTKFSENDNVINDLILIFADLLRSENNQKEENAKTFLQCDDTIPNFVRSLDNKNPQIRVGSMHVLMMIANLQPSLFTESLTSHQPQMIRLFGSISDQNEQISSKFVKMIPKIVENNPDFQQIVGFYAFEALVNSINRERPEFLEALISVIKDNQINQSLFINSGYLNIIENMIKTPDEQILNLMLILFDPYKNANNIDSFRKTLESTNIVNILCDNIIRNVYRQLNIHLLSVCIKGNKDLTDRTKDKISNFVRLTLETRKSASVYNGNISTLDGIDLFGEFFESFIFESEENTHFLNSTIINSQNQGFDGLTESYLNLCTFSVLIAPNFKSDYENIFTSLISNIKRYESIPSMFKFFVCLCWQSKEYCDMISEEERLTILIQFLIDEKSGNNGYFVPNSNLNSSEKRNHFLLLLFAEIILFSGRNRARIGSIVNTTVVPYELENSINQSENSEFTDNSKFSQLEKQIINYIGEHHLNDAMKQFKNEENNNDDNANDDDDFYQTEYNRLQKENKELKNKLIENEDNLNRIKDENIEKNRQIESLLSKVDNQEIPASNEANPKVISKEIQLDNVIEEEEEDQNNNNNNNDDLGNIIRNLQSENQSIKEINNKLTQENQAIKEQNERMNQNLDEIQKQNSELLEKVSNLQSSIASLQSENEQNESQNKEDSESVLKLHSEIESLKKQLEEKEASEKEEVDKLNSQITELKNQLEDKNTILENEENSKVELRGQIHDLSVQLAESNNNNESLQEQNRISTNELDQLRSSLENAKNISENFQQQINEKNNSISSLQTQNEQLRNKIELKSIETTELIEKYNKEISDLRSQQSLNGGDLISSLNNQIEELKNESSHQKKEFENEKEILRQNISKLQSENNKLESNCNSLLDVKAKLQEEGKKHENDEMLLVSKNEELQRQLDEIKKLNAQKVEAMKLSFEAEKEKIRLENESLQIQLDKFVQNENMNQNELESLRNQINEMKMATVSLNEVEPIRKENIELTKKCNELNSKINELESQLNQTPNSNSEQLNEENNIVELLRIKIVELENQISKATENCAEKDEVISSLNAQVKDAKREQKLNDKLAADLRKTNKDLLDQIIQMQKQIEELQHLFALNSPISLSKQSQNKAKQDVFDRDFQLEVENEKSSKTKSAKSTQNESENDDIFNESNQSIVKLFEEQIEQLNNKINDLENENKSLKQQQNQPKQTIIIEEEEDQDEPSTKRRTGIYNIQKDEENENDNIFKQQIEQLNNKISELQNENQSLQVQLVKSKKIKSETFNLEEEEESAESFKKQIQQLNSQITKLKDENKILQNQSELNQKEKETSSLLMQTLKGQNEELKAIVNNMQNENQSLQVQLSQSSKNKNDEEASKQLQEENKKLKKEIKQNKKEIENNSLLLEALKQKNDELQATLNKIQNEKSNKNEDETVKQLQEENKKLKTQSKQNQKEKESNSLLIKSLKEQNEELKTTLNKVQNEKSNKDEASKQTVKQLQEENKKLKTQSKQNQKEKESNSLLIKTLKEQNEELKATLNRVQEETTENKNLQFTHKQGSPASSKSNYEAVIAKQRKLIDDLRAQNEKLEAGGVEATTKAEEMTSQNEKLRLEIKKNSQETSTRIQELRKKLYQATKENNELRAKLDDSQHKRSSRSPSEKDGSVEKKITFKNRKQKPDISEFSDSYNEANNVNDNDENESENVSALNKKISELQRKNSLLTAENQQLKCAPSKALVAALQDDKADLEAKVLHLQEELDEMKKKQKQKQKKTFDDFNIDEDESNDLSDSFPISPIPSKTSNSKMTNMMKKKKKTSLRDSFEEDRSKLLAEIEFLKRDNENQSQTITDLQMMLGNQSFGSDNGQMFPQAVVAANVYPSVGNELKNLSIENDLLNSKLKEMQEIERENRKLHAENMELKKLIRTRGVNEQIDDSVREPPNMADENQQKKALRIIGQLYLEQKQQKLNM